MKLVEKHILHNKQSAQFKTVDELCYMSKNLYNSALYTIKQHFIETGKVLRYNELEKLLRLGLNENYTALSPNSSQQTLMLLDKNIKSYFALLKKWKSNKSSLSGCPRFPKYKDKTKGRNIVVFTNNQFRIKGNFVHFPKKSKLSPIRTKVRFDTACQVRLIPSASCYTIEVVYDTEDIILKNNVNYASIDLGVNNLATITYNNSKDSSILNGKPLKSINQFYNKKLAYFKSDLEIRHSKKSSNRISKMHLKRNCKVNDYMHKASRHLVNDLVSRDVSKLVIGYNKEWKQGVNLGSKTNQNFTSIPYLRFIEMVKYKCLLSGIEVLTNEESYTSKCSSLDLEALRKHDVYRGKRIKRGLFQTSRGLKINADVNGSLNIGRKVFGDGFIHEFSTNRGYVYYPTKTSFC